MTKLSPQAQAVLDAITAVSPAPADEIATVALRAATDQAVPLVLTVYNDDLTYARHQLLAIAAELEGTTRDPLEPNDLSHLSDEEFKALAPQGFHGL